MSWNDCLSLDTEGLSQKLSSLWMLVSELDAGRCRTVGAHQLSALLENLEALQNRALLDNLGCHFVQRLLSYGLSADYLNATSVLSRPLICWFASNGCTKTCSRLLAAHVNPDVRELNFTEGNPTALLMAAAGGFPDTVQALIEGGADIQLADDFGTTAIHAAAASPGTGDHTQAAVLARLLQHPAAHHVLHRANAKGSSPIACAAAAGYTTCVKLLLKASDPELRPQLAAQALPHAALPGHLEVIEVLLNEGTSGTPEPRDPDKVCCALEVAAENGHVGCVTLMLRSCPQQNDLNKAVLAAAGNGHEHAMLVLLDAGAEVHRTSKLVDHPYIWHHTPLMAAASGGHRCCMQQLLARGADTAHLDSNGTNALMAAAEKGYTECVEVLATAGAAVDSQDNRGMTALMLAAAAGHALVVQTLIELGAAVERLPLQDSSPLLVAAAAGQHDAMAAILNGTAQIDGRGVSGTTALMAVAGRGFTECVQLLLDCDADMDLLDDQGCSALHCAVKARQLEVIQLLLKHGADVDSECVPELFLALSSKGTTQWQLLQMVHASQLGVLLGSGDFAALPIGTAPSDMDQVRQVVQIVNYITAELDPHQPEEISPGDGCAFVQALTFCLKAKQQLSPATNRALVSTVTHHYSIQQLCNIATRILQVLQIPKEPESQSSQAARSVISQSKKENKSTRTLKRQNAMRHPSFNADAALSDAADVHWTKLSVILSSVMAARDGAKLKPQSQAAVSRVQELLACAAKHHAVVFNEAVEAACQANAKQACVIWSWAFAVEGLLSASNWQGLLQGALQALRPSRHMAMWVPRHHMLEDN